MDFANYDTASFYSLCTRHKKPNPCPVATVACFAEPKARSNKPRSNWDANSFSAVALQIGYWKCLYANVTFFCGILGSKVGEIYDEFSLIYRVRCIFLSFYLPFSFWYQNKLTIPFLLKAKECEVICSFFRFISTNQDLSVRYGIIQDSVWTLYPISPLCFQISTCNI
jgi:hypothetical protein